MSTKPKASMRSTVGAARDRPPAAIRRDPLRVLIAGGGVAALEAALALRALAEERVSLELLAPEPHFWYRPLAVVEPFGLGRVHAVELVDLAAEVDAEFTLGALASVHPERHIARTAAGAEIEYDALLVASGARPVAAIDGAFLFRGPADGEAFGRLLGEIVAGAARRLVFALPGGVAWPLPLYELALLTAAFVGAHGASAELTLVTPEESPLAIFGAAAGTAVARLLEERGVTVQPATYPLAVEEGRLRVAAGNDLPADRVVALPRLEGVPIAGLPHDSNGFLRTDRHGRVQEARDVFAAGDVTAFPVKQGGLAAQQADAAAEVIAAAAGAEVVPQPFRPVLRGLLLTGAVPTYLRAELAGGSGDTSIARPEPLWWPPGKIAGKHLAALLARRADVILSPPEADGVRVEVDLTSNLGLAGG